MKFVTLGGLKVREDSEGERTFSLRSSSCLSWVASHSLVSTPFTPFVGFGGVALRVEPRRTMPFAVEEILGGTADLALIAGLVSEGGDREGDEDEMRFEF